MSAEILRKLTIKNCGLTVAGIKAAIEGLKNGEQTPLLKVVGKTNTARPGQTTLGTFIAFGGDFFAINLKTGEQFKSAKCILPNFIAEQLESALKDSDSVEFALEIGAKVNDTSVTGYEFTVRPLIEAKPTESMLSLLNAAGVDLAALPAPKPAAPAAAPAPAPAPAAAPAAEPEKKKKK
jgi:hypothetical protein